MSGSQKHSGGDQCVGTELMGLIIRVQCEESSDIRHCEMVFLRRKAVRQLSGNPSLSRELYGSDVFEVLLEIIDVLAAQESATYFLD